MKLKVEMIMSTNEKNTEATTQETPESWTDQDLWEDALVKGLTRFMTQEEYDAANIDREKIVLYPMAMSWEVE
jgi:hypothetical protein